MIISTRSIFPRVFWVAWLSIAGLITASGAVTRVACVGDSITFGNGVRDRPANTWPARLAVWFGPDYEVRNFGVSGATLLSQGDRPYLKQHAYAEALNFKPDILVMDLGANDSKHPGDGSLDADQAVNNWQYQTNYVPEYEAMITAFRRVNPAVKVYVCLPTPDYPGRWGINDKTIREEMIPLVRQVAKDSGAAVIDLYTPLSGHAELFPDAVHPNDAGTKLMAVEIYRALTGHAPPPVPDLALRLLMNRRVLWLGDSITQDGKYVSFVEYYLDRQFPGQNFDFISIGLSSETVSGLSEQAHPFPRPCVFERLQRALDAASPATVVACYGMNDGIYHPQSGERMQAFSDGIRRLGGAVQTAGAQFILLTPPPFDPLPVKTVRPETAPDFSYRNPFTNYDSVLADYGRWELGLPVNDARVVVDLHAPLAQYLARQRVKNPGFSFTKDGIHPSALGHLLMAQAILRSLGVAVDGGDPETELKRIEADPLFKMVCEHRENRSSGWLGYVGCTRDQTVKTGSVDEVENAAAILQMKIDAARRSSARPIP
jgi:lysophospholipase L1-like esterase